MTKADLFVERGANRLQQLARQAAGRGDGIGEWLSEELQQDADFLRKLKPSLIKARAKGQNPSMPQATPQPSPPPPEAKPQKPKKKKSGGGPSPLLVVGAALAAGIVIAKVVDWRGHAHPRD
jgi:hypothetical protein